MRGPVGGAVEAGAMAQMHGKLFVEGAVYMGELCGGCGPALWGKLYVRV